MTRTTIPLLSLIALGMASGACTRVDSATVPTSKMAASIDVQSTNATQSHVSVVLSADSDALIDTNTIALSSGDVLIAEVNGDQKTLTGTTLLGYTAYQTDFDAVAEGTVFNVELVRAAGVNATSSSATLPSPFELGATPTTASRAVAIPVTWSPTGALPVSVTATGDCIGSFDSGVIADAGSYTIPAGALHASASASTPTTCTISVSVTRSAAGTVDPAFGLGGKATASQVRIAHVTSTP